jgi:DNA-binding transcriptional ArsR family regulator
MPLFRSQAGLALLGELFTGATRPARSVSELARAADVPVQTAARELARLEEAGIVVSVAQGRNKLVSANWDLPWAHDLANMLDKTVGPQAFLSDALGDVHGLRAAWIFGSWAARYRGEPGTSPHDIDIVLVGVDLDTVEVARSLRGVTRRIGLEINPIYVTPDEWDSNDPGPFLMQLRERPLVQLAVGERASA